ncbi:unnamed protein product [Microthlaspi erraticum]|uniref:F-box domain-containing protein n=1 Tax=Microthlaspi erraticum TaxID=1685480 RepID=A0A6D2HIG4_9BRAS|nr:unnamed protein product [Microthlaspi erraticum]CAA7018106.1 unnamed protein product [Microthlaspi erraticum]
MGLSFLPSVTKRKRTERRKEIRMGLSRNKRGRRRRPEKEISRKKRRRRINMGIPKDVVMEEILTRLSPKSLMRFKCVSKLWSSLISSRYFKNRFLTVP